MKIQSLYRDYIQKSKLFLYPLLDIKRGVSVTPTETYMAWKGKYEFTGLTERPLGKLLGKQKLNIPNLGPFKVNF